MFQYSQRPQSIPTAGPARFLHVKMDLTRMPGLNRPYAIFPPFLPQYIKRILHTGIVANAGKLKIIERS
jgi:hypothetical protein